MISGVITKQDLEDLERRLNRAIRDLGDVALANSMKVERARFCGSCGVLTPNPGSGWCPRCGVFTHCRGNR